MTVCGCNDHAGFCHQYCRDSEEEFDSFSIVSSQCGREEEISTTMNEVQALIDEGQSLIGVHVPRPTENIVSTERTSLHVVQNDREATTAEEQTEDEEGLADITSHLTLSATSVLEVLVRTEATKEEAGIAELDSIQTLQSHRTPVVMAGTEAGSATPTELQRDNGDVNRDRNAPSGVPNILEHSPFVLEDGPPISTHFPLANSPLFCMVQTKRGVRCTHIAEKESSYCEDHLLRSKTFFPAPVISQCTATSTEGVRCQNTARKGRSFCRKHYPYQSVSAGGSILQCQHISRKRGNRCKNTAKKRGLYCGIHALSHVQIQVVQSHLVQQSELKQAQLRFSPPTTKVIVMCNGTTNGIKCHDMAKQGSSLCRRHVIQLLSGPTVPTVHIVKTGKHCIAVTNRGKYCVNAALGDSFFCLNHRRPESVVRPLGRARVNSDVFKSRHECFHIPGSDGQFVLQRCMTATITGKICKNTARNGTYYCRQHEER